MIQNPKKILTELFLEADTQSTMERVNTATPGTTWVGPPPTAISYECDSNGNEINHKFHIAGHDGAIETVFQYRCDQSGRISRQPHDLDGNPTGPSRRIFPEPDPAHAPRPGIRI